MAELPSLVRVKRKRGEEPTADLFLEERTSKKQQVWQFRLQQTHPSQQQQQQQQQPSNGRVASTIPSTSTSNLAQLPVDHHQKQDDQHEAPVRREFRLARPTRPIQARIDRARKRKAQSEPQDIPTFVEATLKRRRVDQESPALPVAHPSAAENTSTLKRPVANTRNREKRPENSTKPAPPPSATARPPSGRVADALHQFALEEEAREEAREKPKVTIIPKRPVQRYRDRHPEEFALQKAQAQQKADADVDMSDDDDYVYDTYVRTKEPVVPFSLDTADPANEQIGYIVISEEDQPLWETYFEEDGESDKEFETDDEDENAEGYYAADYPEDEVASDDEFDRGAYGYRHGGSDDEQWDSDPADWSGDDDAMQNPWRKFPWMQNNRPAAKLSDDEDGQD